MCTRLFRAATVVFALGWQASAALADAQENQSPAPAIQGGDVLLFSSAGLDGILVDPKDDGLRRAIELIDDRIQELPRETGDQNLPASVLNLLLDLKLRPMNGRIGLLPDANRDDDAEEDDVPPIYLQLNFPTVQMQEAQALAGRFAAALAVVAPDDAKRGRAAPEYPDLQMIELHGMPLYYGATRLLNPSGAKDAGGAPGTSAFVIAFNKVDATPVRITATDLPPNVTKALAVKVDFQKLQPLIARMLDEGGLPPDQAEQARQQLETWGMYGEDAMVISSSLGYAPDRALAVTRLTNIGRSMRELNLLAQRPLSAADLQHIPADATFAQVGRYNLSAFGGPLQQQAVQQDDANREDNEPDDPMSQLERMTGIHPQRDVLDHLGELIGVYTSYSTGGGGLLSGVAFVEVANTEALNQTITRFVASFNQLATFAGKGYVRIGERAVGELRMHTLAFPGLPVPLELSFTVANDFLYAAFSPQALLTAVSQGTGNAGRGPGLAANPRFAEQAQREMTNVIRVTFLDSPRLIPEGYSTMNLLLAALSNAVRSPARPERGVDIIMPPLPVLVENARAFVSIQQLQGDDIVSYTQLDRSALVNAAGVVGLLRGSVAPLIGVILPAMQKAREAAQQQMHQEAEMLLLP